MRSRSKCEDLFRNECKLRETKSFRWEEFYDNTSRSLKEKYAEMMKKILLILAANLLMGAKPPDLLSFAVGAFDFYRDKYRTFEFAIEYKFRPFWSPNPHVDLRPLVGIMATAEKSFYTYVGINFDVLFGPILVAPGFAAGVYAPGDGKRLGYPLEFRSGVELAYQFSDYRRMGLHFYHLSNASLGKKNPGEESLVFFYDIPITRGFPFK